jgi:hypothetical protein
MKSVILNGQKITIGSKVRYVNNKDLYPSDKKNEIIKPRIGKVYTVRGFTHENGFYLEEIVNKVIDWFPNGKYESTCEPGFGVWRFEPYVPLYDNVEIECEFEKVVEEKIEKPVKVSPKKTKKEEFQLN